MVEESKKQKKKKKPSCCAKEWWRRAAHVFDEEQRRHSRSSAGWEAVFIPIPTLPKPIPSLPKRPNEASHPSESRRREESASAPPAKKVRTDVVTTGRSIPRFSRPSGKEGTVRRGLASYSQSLSPLSNWIPLGQSFPWLSYVSSSSGKRESQSVKVVSKLTKPAPAVEEKKTPLQYALST